MDVSTIIVSYDTFDLTREAVRTALEAAPGLAHEVLVVDNESPDESARRLREAFDGDDRVRVIESGGNIGFSAANNVGAREARGDVFFFLNPDTLSHGDVITALARYLREHPHAGAVGPRVLNEDGSDQTCSGWAPSYRQVLTHYFAPHVGPARAARADGRPLPVDIVKGCSLAVRRDAFERVGGWDERTFMYAEENELCLALLDAGYQNWLLPTATITHFGGAASADRYVEQQVVAVRTSVEFLRRHGTPGLVAFDRAMGVAGMAARRIAFGVLGALRPSRRDDYHLRGQAAGALLRWYAFDHG